MKGTLFCLLIVSLTIPANARIIGPDAQVLNGLPSDLQTTLEFLFASASHGDKALVGRSINSMLQFKAENMYDNVSPLAAQALAGMELTSGLDNKARVRMLEKVVAMAPDLPKSRMALAKAYLKSGDTPATVSTLTSAAESFFRYMPGLFVSMGNLSFYLEQAISLAVILFVISLFIRKMPLLGHDIVDMLPGVRMNVMDVWNPHEQYMMLERHTERLGRWLIIVVAFVPLAIGMGLLPAALLWLVVLGLYMQGRELRAAVFMVILASLIPVMALQVGLSRGIQHSLGAAIYNCGTDMCSKAEASRLIQVKDTRQNRDAKNLALAIHELHRVAHHPQAVDEARTFTMQMPDSPAKFTMLGNIDMIEAFQYCRKTIMAADPIPDPKYLKDARKWYSKAMAQAPDDIAPLYGMILLAAYSHDKDAMDRLQRKLVELTPEKDLNKISKIREALGYKDFCKNQALMRGLLRNPKFPWSRAYITGLNIMDIRMWFPLPTVLVGNMPKMMLLLMGPIALILLLLASAVGKGLSLAHTCPKCSTVSCSKCNVKTTGFDYCPTCLLSEVRGGMIAQEDAFRLRRHSEARKQRGRVLNLLSSLFIPGTGQVTAGRLGLGVVLLLSVSILLIWVAYPWPPFFELRTFTGFKAMEPSLIPPILLVIVYGISWVEAWRRQVM